MYKRMFEYLQDYADGACRKKNEIQMPIPIGRCIRFIVNCLGYKWFNSIIFCSVLKFIMNILFNFYLSFPLPFFGKRQRTRSAGYGKPPRPGL